MGFLMPKPPAPAAPPPIPPAAHPATMADPNVAMSAANARRRAAAAGANMGGTLTTGPQGLNATPTTNATLLGGTK